MSNPKVLFGFHAVGVRLKTAPKSIVEIYIDPTRRDARMRQFVDRVKEAGVRLLEADGLRLAKLCGSHGHQGVAARVQALLAAGGMAANLDDVRGFDHGTFSVLQPVYPEETMPVVQLSMNASMDPALHLAIGRLLAPLRDEGVLIIGSGLSYHNLRMMDPRAKEPSALFDAWLQDALVGHAGADRSAMLTQWTAAPAARLAHPREDHLIPLMVATGAAEAEEGACVYHQPDLLNNLTASSFRFGAVPA